MRPSKFTTVIVVGLAIRLLLAPFFAHPFDVYAAYVNGEAVLNGTQSAWGYLAPYSYSYFLYAFPATMAFRSLSGLIGSYTIPMSALNPALNPGAQWNIAVVPGLLFDFLVKLPLIASDTIVAILLYRMVSRHTGDEKAALSASAAWFLNPLVIWVSSGWGMFDTLPALFTVLSLYFVMEKRFAYSGLALVVAVAMKYYAAVLAIPLLVIAWRKGGRRGVINSLVAIALSSAVLFLPLLARALLGFTSLVAGAPQTGPSYSGLSFWTAITLFMPLPDQTLLSSALIVASLAGVYYWMLRRNSYDLYSCAAYFGLSIIPLLAFFRFVGENFFVWLIPFASILVLQEARGRKLLWGLSIAALVSSVTDSLLPYYMLPMAPWIGGYLVSILSLVSPYRVASGGAVVHVVSAGKLFLAGLGILAAILLALIAMGWLSMNKVRSDDIPDRDSTNQKETLQYG